MSAKLYDQVVRDHTPGDLDLGACGCNINVTWSPQHVFDELGKVGWRLVNTGHMVAYVEAANKYTAIVQSAYKLLKGWRTGERASSDPELDMLFLCSDQVEELVGLKLKEDDPMYSPDYKAWKASR